MLVSALSRCPLSDLVISSIPSTVVHSVTEISVFDSDDHVFGSKGE